MSRARVWFRNVVFMSGAFDGVVEYEGYLGGVMLPLCDQHIPIPSIWLARKTRDRRLTPASPSGFHHDCLAAGVAGVSIS